MTVKPLAQAGTTPTPSEVLALLSATDETRAMEQLLTSIPNWLGARRAWLVRIGDNPELVAARTPLELRCHPTDPKPLHLVPELDAGQIARTAAATTPLNQPPHPIRDGELSFIPLVFQTRTQAVLVLDLPTTPLPAESWISSSFACTHVAAVIHTARLQTTLSRQSLEHSRAEESRQREKMDAIGQLAGGVAHDFNNQLSGIMGFADLLAESLDDPELKSFALKIIRSATRASDLTRQLLAFGRKGKHLSTPTPIHKLIMEVTELLRRSIDKRITITLQLDATNPTVLADNTQLQQAILNLGLNARDAMPQGGELLFATDVVPLTSAQTIDNLAPGRYVRIHVTDTGIGMDSSIKKHLFEPFFTTQAIGKGTGLGLASAYGTVRNHGGAIQVQSEPGRGSTFTVYLPVFARLSPDTPASTPETTTLPTQPRRILIVDDETMILDLGASMLRRRGYEVTLCADPCEALTLYRKEWPQIHLVILDQMMPRMSGRDLFLAMREINPAIRALLASGFSIDGDTQDILDLGVLEFVQKPFRMDDLSRSVARAMEELPRASGS